MHEAAREIAVATAVAAVEDGVAPKATEGKLRTAVTCDPVGPAVRTLTRRAGSALGLRRHDEARDKARVGVGRLRAGDPA
ncbi:hypothetical protein ACFWP7_31050 [Streptomyces sp. NPDC058470]|uniref:hypothetical protein n=1 Tax=Streptomyces sp. NPDC058470 TaxID=3346515 RepID=UPI00365B5ADB